MLKSCYKEPATYLLSLTVFSDTKQENLPGRLGRFANS
jgi:hypothetical protein